MKPELTNENKARFFALYWGQELGRYVDEKGGHSKCLYLLKGSNLRNIESDFIELKPISSISDEDLAGVDFTFPNGKPEDLQMEFYPESHDIHWQAKSKGNITRGVFRLDHWDFLRSRGYALPWMGLSVDEMIAAGWIKLTDK